MSTYLYLTAEKKVGDCWKLISPMESNSDLDGKLCPPLIVNGGWSKLAKTIVDFNKNWSLPSDISDEFRNFFNENLTGWSFGWGMYRDMKNIRIETSIGKKEKFGILFKHLTNRGNLRLLYWWG